jgi:hypothetical protein
MQIRGAALWVFYLVCTLHCEFCDQHLHAGKRAAMRARSPALLHPSCQLGGYDAWG